MKERDRRDCWLKNAFLKSFEEEKGIKRPTTKEKQLTIKRRGADKDLKKTLNMMISMAFSLKRKSADAIGQM